MHRIFYVFLREDKRMKAREMEIDTAERKQMLWNSNKSNKQKLINLEASIRAKSCLQGNNTAQERTSQLTSTSKSFEWPHNTLEVSEVSRTEYISSLVVVVVWMSWVLRNLLPRPRARIRKPAFRRSRDGPPPSFENSFCHCNQHLGTKDMINSKVLMSDLITSR